MHGMNAFMSQPPVHYSPPPSFQQSPAGDPFYTPGTGVPPYLNGINWTNPGLVQTHLPGGQWISGNAQNMLDKALESQGPPLESRPRAPIAYALRQNSAPAPTTTPLEASSMPVDATMPLLDETTRSASPEALLDSLLASKNGKQQKK